MSLQYHKQTALLPNRVSMAIKSLPGSGAAGLIFPCHINICSSLGGSKNYNS